MEYQNQAPNPAAPSSSIDEQLKTGTWTHGLCGCFDNLSVCIIAYFVPCVTFGQTRQRLTGDGCVLYGCLYTIPFVNCFLEMQQRGELRQQRGIAGGAVGDFCLICWCTLCTLVQEEQEAIALEQQKTALQAGTFVPPGGAVIITTGGVMAPGQQVPTYPPGPGQPVHTYPPGPMPQQQAMYPPPAYPAYSQAPPQDVKSAEMERA